MDYLILPTHGSSTYDCCFLGSKCTQCNGKVVACGANCKTLCAANCSTLCGAKACHPRQDPMFNNSNF